MNLPREGQLKQKDKKNPEYKKERERNQERKGRNN